MYKMLFLEVFTCTLLGGLYGAIKAEARRLCKRRASEEKELAKWQAELERKASQLRKNEVK